MELLTLDGMRAVEMEIVDEIDRICTEHGLKCFLACGSLLGALRHKGFIPWDDDMDMYMLRADYNEFVEHFDEWRSSDRFELLSPRKGNSVYPFAKVVDTTTIVKQSVVRDEASCGIWVDIFVQEGIDPQGNPNIPAIKRLNVLRYLAITDPRSGSSPAVRLGKRIVCPFARRLDARRLSERIEKLAADASLPQADYVADVIGHEGVATRYVYRASWFDQVVRLPFEDRSYPAPVGYLEVVETRYGKDWRTPPPEDQRIPHTAEAYRI